ncbi:hypothetical protein SVAN01_09666, partial [Stagonosporopsis vannaccii]
SEARRGGARTRATSGGRWAAGGLQRAAAAVCRAGPEQRRRGGSFTGGQRAVQWAGRGGRWANAVQCGAASSEQQAASNKQQAAGLAKLTSCMYHAAATAASALPLHHRHSLRPYAATGPHLRLTTGPCCRYQNTHSGRPAPRTYKHTHTHTHTSTHTHTHTTTQQHNKKSTHPPSACRQEHLPSRTSPNQRDPGTCVAQPDSTRPDSANHCLQRSALIDTHPHRARAPPQTTPASSPAAQPASQTHQHAALKPSPSSSADAQGIARIATDRPGAPSPLIRTALRRALAAVDVDNTSKNPGVAH